MHTLVFDVADTVETELGCAFAEEDRADVDSCGREFLLMVVDIGKKIVWRGVPDVAAAASFNGKSNLPM
jgi:hypothetical protein